MGVIMLCDYCSVYRYRMVVMMVSDRLCMFIGMCSIMCVCLVGCEGMGVIVVGLVCGCVILGGWLFLLFCVVDGCFFVN